MSKALPETGIIGRLIGGPFGPKENCTLQSAATSAGGIGILFVSAVPAMYSLGLLSENPVDDFGKLVALTVTAGFFGMYIIRITVLSVLTGTYRCLLRYSFAQILHHQTEAYFPYSRGDCLHRESFLSCFWFKFRLLFLDSGST